MKTKLAEFACPLRNCPLEPWSPVLDIGSTPDFKTRMLYSVQIQQPCGKIAAELNLAASGPFIINEGDVLFVQKELVSDGTTVLISLFRVSVK